MHKKFDSSASKNFCHPWLFLLEKTHQQGWTLESKQGKDDRRQRHLMGYAEINDGSTREAPQQ